MATGTDSTGRRQHKTRAADLSAREVRFAVAYAETGNATEAYRSAGFPAHPPGSTWVLASRVLRKVKVRELIQKLRAEALDVARVSQNTVGQALIRAAFADLRKLYDDRGRIKLPHEWPDELALVIDEVQSEELFETLTETDPATNKPVKRRRLRGHTRKVKLTKRMDALRTLAAWMRMTGPDVPPLDVLLAALPPHISATVRDAIARAVAPTEGGSNTGGVGGDASLNAI